MPQEGNESAIRISIKGAINGALDTNMLFPMEINQAFRSSRESENEKKTSGRSKN